MNFHCAMDKNCPRRLIVILIFLNKIKISFQGKFSEKWSLVTKAAIAESILNLTRLEEVFRTNENCIKTATLWLALASLCVLDKDHVER